MSTNTFFAFFLFIALSISMVAQAENPSEGSAAAAGTPHQRQAVEGIEPRHAVQPFGSRPGRISTGEIKGDRGLAENWERLDDNGYLSPEEFGKFSRKISSP